MTTCDTVDWREQSPPTRPSVAIANKAHPLQLSRQSVLSFEKFNELINGKTP